MIRRFRKGAKIVLAAARECPKFELLRARKERTMRITDRERAEEELRESNRRIEKILESITDEFFAVDREWRFTYINERALRSIQRLKGDEELMREDVLGKNQWEVVPEVVGSVFYQKYHEAMREQKTVHFEAYSPFSDRWGEVHAYASEEGLSVYAHDVTQRKRAEEQLRYHASLLENVHDAVIATDERLVVTAWNKGAERMYGWRADEALGRHIWEIVPVNMSEEQRAEALRELDERGRFRTEVITHGKDGTPVYVEGITIALRGEQKAGQITGYVNIRRDITERKRAEEAVQNAQAESAHMSRVCTVATLTTSIAHELNQPLAAIVATGGACRRWLEHEPPNLDEARKAAERVIDGAIRAGDIVKAIRALLRKTEPAIMPLDINETIQQAIALAEGELRKNYVLLQTELAPDLRRVLGDRIQLQQVLLNLILNSNEAMSTVNWSRELLIRSQESEPAEVMITVQDSGVGLPPDFAEQIFDTFFSTKASGMGLGLSISRMIVEAHGGRIWATRNHGRGTTFQFTLPATSSQE